jgi:hypothetical protein
MGTTTRINQEQFDGPFREKTFRRASMRATRAFLFRYGYRIVIKGKG